MKIWVVICIIAVVAGAMLLLTLPQGTSPSSEAVVADQPGTFKECMITEVGKEEYPLHVLCRTDQECVEITKVDECFDVEDFDEKYSLRCIPTKFVPMENPPAYWCDEDSDCFPDEYWTSNPEKNEYLQKVFVCISDTCHTTENVQKERRWPVSEV